MALPESALVPAPLAARMSRTLQSLPVGMRDEFRGRVAARIESGQLVQEALSSLLMEAFARTQSIDCFSLLYELSHRQDRKSTRLNSSH